MRYDFSQEHANEMLEKADKYSDELVSKVATLENKIQEQAREISRLVFELGLTDAEQKQQLAALTTERDRMREALRSMLYIFDRKLPNGSIGGHCCNDARAALDGVK